MRKERSNMKYFELLLEKKKFFENYLHYAKILKESAKKALKDEDLRLLVFGSVVEKDFTLASDIDVIIISEKTPAQGMKRAKVLKEIYTSLPLPNPFEIHLLRKIDWEEWYKHFVKNFIEV